MNQTIDNQALDTLLHRAKSGDEAGLGELCDVVRVRLMGLVRFKVRGWSREDHEDLVQDTLSIFVRDLSKIDHSPLTYAYAVLQKRIWNELDKARRNREVSLDNRLRETDSSHSANANDGQLLRDDSADVADEVERKIKMERVWQAIQSLNHEFCKPLLTAIMEGYEIGELWERFSALDPHLNRNTFYKRVFDCRKRLWAVLGGVL
jgi:DNA-directed RNA polymerase specialized sigma24 family protein